VLGIFISQSGETRDVLQVQEKYKKLGHQTMGISNMVDSKLVKETDFGCFVHAGYEHSVPSTKTFMGSVVVQILVALWFSHFTDRSSFIKLRKDICMSLLVFNTYISRRLLTKKTCLSRSRSWRRWRNWLS
jgi:glucosamine 6-phosphate synthetase-like amidotransferase/phosphosugar isomerase protein